jgi:replication initiation and membrane attachment protein DnaB
MTKEAEVIKHFQTWDIEEHLKSLLVDDKPNHITTKQFLMLYKKHSLNKEVFNVLISFCQQVVGKLLLDTAIPLAKRWEQLGIDTAEKAMKQAKDEYDVIEIFRSGISLNATFMNEFDFDLLRAGLSELVPESIFTSVTKELIIRIAFLYSLTLIDMQKVVMLAMDDELKLSEVKLREVSAQYYKLKMA